MTVKIKSIPKLGDKGDDVLTLQAALLTHDFNPGPLDTEFGPKTESAVKACQKSHGLPGSGRIGPVTLECLGLEVEVEKDASGNWPSWYVEAKKYEGSKETDSKFAAFMVTFWAKAGLPQFKSISGSKFAWCALFVLMSLSTGGVAYKKLNASAISGDNVGQKIDWKVNGIPRGAIVRINHGANCTTSSNNHIGFADGDCAPEDILKNGAKFNMFGGNQGDMAKVSAFPVAHICAVRWPAEQPLPGKILKSDHCSGAPTPGGESTR